MILLRKSGKTSVRLEFDRSGAIDLETAFGEERRTVSIFVERALLGGRQARRGGVTETLFQVSPANGEADMIALQPDKILLRIDSDSADHVRHRLQACIPGGFFPSEIAEVSLGARADIVSLYGEYKDPLVP